NGTFCSSLGDGCVIRGRFCVRVVRRAAADLSEPEPYAVTSHAPPGKLQQQVAVSRWLVPKTDLIAQLYSHREYASPVCAGKTDDREPVLMPGGVRSVNAKSVSSLIRHEIEICYKEGGVGVRF